MNKELEKAKQDAENKQKEYLKAHAKWAKLRDEAALPEVNKKYAGKFFKGRVRENTYLFVIQMWDVAYGEVVEFEYSNSREYTEYSFLYHKKYYIGREIGREVKSSDAVDKIKSYIEGIKNMFPVDLRD